MLAPAEELRFTFRPRHEVTPHLQLLVHHNSLGLWGLDNVVIPCLNKLRHNPLRCPSLTWWTCMSHLEWPCFRDCHSLFLLLELHEGCRNFSATQIWSEKYRRASFQQEGSPVNTKSWRSLCPSRSSAQIRTVSRKSLVLGIAGLPDFFLPIKRLPNPKNCRYIWLQ